MKKLFMDTLFACLDYRNCAAHGGRIYTFEPKNANDINDYDELFELLPELEDIKYRHGISQLLTHIETGNKSPFIFICTRQGLLRKGFRV